MKKIIIFSLFFAVLAAFVLPEANADHAHSFIEKTVKDSFAKKSDSPIIISLEGSFETCLDKYSSSDDNVKVLAILPEEFKLNHPKIAYFTPHSHYEDRILSCKKNLWSERIFFHPHKVRLLI